MPAGADELLRRFQQGRRHGRGVWAACYAVVFFHLCCEFDRFALGLAKHVLQQASDEGHRRVVFIMDNETDGFRRGNNIVHGPTLLAQPRHEKNKTRTS
jgi:hypothetical protein